MTKQLLSRNEAAQFLNMSRAFLDIWTRKGKIKTVPMGRKVMYRIIDLQQIIDGDGLVKENE